MSALCINPVAKPSIARHMAANKPPAAVSKCANGPCREDFDAVQDITKFKTAATWGADPMASVETKTKAAFTRSFNKAGLPVRTTIMVEDGKKGVKKAARPPPPADDDEDALGGEIADVRFCYQLRVHM
jgi:hypothetical protein